MKSHDEIGPIVMAGTVQQEWVDYNGHMNYAYFVVAFDRATDVLFEHLDLGTAYRVRSGQTIYVVETHVNYLKELKGGDAFSVETIIANADEKLLHLFQRLLNEKHDVAATSEVLCLHVDQNGHVPRVRPFDPAHAAAIRGLMNDQAGCPRELSRFIAIKGESASL